jgi:hypothetical protein
MAPDPFYKSKTWRLISEVVRQRSRGWCEVPGCGRPGKVFDHILRRTDGGADDPSNVRHLCRDHDNIIKEDASGKRRSGGRLTLRGCDEHGIPLEGSHWWRSDSPKKSLGAERPGPARSKIES